MANGMGVSGTERLREAKVIRNHSLCTCLSSPSLSPLCTHNGMDSRLHPGSPYLSHIANHNCHDDAVDGNSLTENDAISDNGRDKSRGGEEKKMR